ncbi:MAG: Hsp20/alpha crystallin family protein [Burkholderiales bacterium]
MNLIRYESLPAVRDAFDDFFGGVFNRPISRSTRFNESLSSVPMPVDVRDENGTLKLRADLPGVKKEDIQVTVDRDVISIVAESRGDVEQEAANGLMYRERFTGRYARSFRLNSEVELDKANATYVDGVLELVLPKKSAAAKQLPIH